MLRYRARKRSPNDKYKRAANHIREKGTEIFPSPPLTGKPHRVWQHRSITYIEYEDIPNIMMILQKGKIAQFEEKIERQARRNGEMVGAWFLEGWESDRENVISTNELYRSYTERCRSDDLDAVPMSRTKFGAMIRQRFPNVVKTRRRINGKLTYMYQGIRLKQSA